VTRFLERVVSKPRWDKFRIAAIALHGMEKIPRQSKKNFSVGMTTESTKLQVLQKLENGLLNSAVKIEAKAS